MSIKSFFIPSLALKPEIPIIKILPQHYYTIILCICSYTTSMCSLRSNTIRTQYLSCRTFITRGFITTVNTKENFLLITLFTKFLSDITVPSWQVNFHLPYFIMTCQCDLASFSCLMSDAMHLLSTFLQ